MTKKPHNRFHVGYEKGYQCCPYCNLQTGPGGEGDLQIKFYPRMELEIGIGMESGLNKHTQTIRLNSPAELAAVIQHGAGVSVRHPVQSQRARSGRRGGVQKGQGPIVVFVVLMGRMEWSYLVTPVYRTHETGTYV